jgi:pyruvate formate lyase activating enzyme
MKGTVFNIQRYSTHDGPGIRTTVFLKGCPLSCTWCHNPEGLDPSPEVVVVPDRCVGCAACVEVCPQGTALGPDGRAAAAPASCVRCGRCVEVCVAGARRMVGSEMTVEEFVAEVERDAPFYATSGGGVTFSGGEPLAQPDFLTACLEALGSRGVRTAVDTTGHADPGVISRVVALTGLFLFDLKLIDDSRHLNLTGAPVSRALDNLRTLDESGAEIWMRFPLIPGVTDDEENVTAVGETVASLANTRRVYILPFHRIAADKYARTGRPWNHADVEPVTQEALARTEEILASFGLDVRKGG